MEQTSVMVFSSFLVFILLASVQGTRTMDGKSEAKQMAGNGCSLMDIKIRQAPTMPLPDGIPAFLVEISNVCSNGCTISNIHASCGAFSSATLINPNIFKRLANNDCLVNGGRPLLDGRTISFRYANTHSYSISVSSVSC